MQTSKQFWYGIGLGVLGIVLFSSKAVMVKLAYNYKVDSISILLLRMLFSFPFYLVIAYWHRNQKVKANPNQKDYLWLVFFGFVGYYLASYFDFVGLTYIKASLERIILFLYPTIVLLLNKLFLKQPISKIQGLAIGLTYLGIVIAFSNEVSITGIDTYLGGFYILLSAITYASYLVGSGWLIPKFGVIKFTAYAMLVSCVCVFIHYGFIRELNLLGFSWQVYVLGALIAVFATVIPSFLVSASIKMISSSNFAIVAGVGPISTIILAGVFLNEVLTWVQLFGALVVIIGILLVSLNKTSNT
ncbi:DMT family transporter [Algibacter amylolyticus]|uniref:DMT family transporter n=1 Tax=Algibacter amylolyticus TaxID=1608400 RepID=A0A5M7B541_9FLAO|nr:DMT family transporter [Algibacter amylolyticus]KAA5823487.1 DMT family transporter [Algibacter amylolyticus]MBB5267637.1 drug/metabolite transporter (DMT)-like permease [Algibacter amylolyticus]TSJ73975.1 DMT family transporter [Algibacter amylolyticus]